MHLPIHPVADRINAELRLPESWFMASGLGNKNLAVGETSTQANCQLLTSLLRNETCHVARQPHQTIGSLSHIMSVNEVASTHTPSLKEWEAFRTQPGMTPAPN